MVNPRNQARNAREEVEEEEEEEEDFFSEFELDDVFQRSINHRREREMDDVKGGATVYRVRDMG